MSKTLVIVESPTKAKTISKFLGADFKVESSMGHIRDLPKSSMGIDIEGGTFEPTYEISDEKKKKVAELKKLAKDADDILFATDEDREGEAISWHLAEILKIKPKDVKRLVFHEITKEAIHKAIENPRPLDINLVDAQQARRVLDRLVGYELSPLLWRKVKPGLSAGRVQSIAVHLTVMREKERLAFKSASYFDLVAKLKAKDGEFEAKLISYGALPIPSKKDFDEATGLPKNIEQILLLNEIEATKLANLLLSSKPWTVTDLKETSYKTNPYPPFVTSTLQQEGSRKLGWSAKQTMRTAQSLYENGYITYMRTDSTHLSDQAISAAREAAKEFGAEYVTDSPRQYETKSKGAQEAHEAIRPAGSHFRHPGEMVTEVNRDEARLYDLIWKRTVASQMKSAEMMSLSVKIGIEKAEFEAKGKRIIFAGYLRAYVEGSDDVDAELEDKEISLPKLKQDEAVEPQEVLALGHNTEPPARYTEASLIKKMETEGIGRPSTYATIMDTIVERNYVMKQGNALVPTFTAMIVDEFLQKHFKPLVDVRFTSRMEENLDLIAAGKKEWTPYIKFFYADSPGFALKRGVENAKADPTYPTYIIGKNPKNNEEIIVKSGKFGFYLQSKENGEDKKATLPETLAPADMSPEMAEELLAKPSGPVVITTDPKTNLPVTLRNGRFGPYLQIGEDSEEKKSKKIGLQYGAKRLPISKIFDLNNLTEEAALKIIELPRELGEVDSAEPGQKEKIIASIGKFGPYIKKGTDYRSVPADMDLLTITLADAIALLALPKKASVRRTATVLKELGTDPKSAKPVQILDGKYGPYISNGTKTFVSVPKDTPPENITLDEALLMLEEKSAKGKPRRKKKK